MPIKFKALNYIYDEGMPFQHTALKDINLEIKENKITAIIGETGSGKSTLVQHLNGLFLPSAGELEILDFNITKDKHDDLKKLRENVGLVFQFSEYQLFEETVLKDVAFGPKNFGHSEEEAIVKAKKALKMVGLDESFYELNPLELSGGQKRRVAIAGILSIDPKVIVLDEPTAGLDPKGSKEMIELFISLNKQYGKTIILVTHDNEIVYKYADEVVLVSKGEIAYSGDTLAFFENNEIIDKYHILLPMILNFKNELIKNGFNIKENSRDIKSIISDVRGQINE